MLQFLEKNNILKAIIVLLTYIGASSVSMDLGKTGRKFLKLPVVRHLIILLLLYSGTKNWWVSIATTLVYVVITKLINSDSPLYILGQDFADFDTDKDGNLSPDEIEKIYNKLKQEGKLPSQKSS